MKSLPKNYRAFRRGIIREGDLVRKTGQDWEKAKGLVGASIHLIGSYWHAASPKDRGWNVTFATRKDARLAAGCVWKGVLKGPHKA